MMTTSRSRSFHPGQQAASRHQPEVVLAPRHPGVGLVEEQHRPARCLTIGAGFSVSPMLPRGRRDGTADVLPLQCCAAIDLGDHPGNGGLAGPGGPANTKWCVLGDRPRCLRTSSMATGALQPRHLAFDSSSRPMNSASWSRPAAAALRSWGRDRRNRAGLGRRSYGSVRLDPPGCGGDDPKLVSGQPARPVRFSGEPHTSPAALRWPTPHPHARSTSAGQCTGRQQRPRQTAGFLQIQRRANMPSRGQCGAQVTGRACEKRPPRSGLAIIGVSSLPHPTSAGAYVG